MTRICGLAALVLLLLLAATQSQAQVPAPAQPAEDGTNMAAPYPPPPCEKPVQKNLGPPGNDAEAMATYNTRVRSFNKKAADFNACMKTYTDKANADIRRIQATVNGAVAAANAK